MEHFPALNADCFDMQIAECLQLKESPRIFLLQQLSKLSSDVRGRAKCKCPQCAMTLTQNPAPFRNRIPA